MKTKFHGIRGIIKRVMALRDIIDSVYRMLKAVGNALVIDLVLRNVYQIPPPPALITLTRLNDRPVGYTNINLSTSVRCHQNRLFKVKENW